MERKSVVSSDIASIGYIAAYQILEIEFHSGGIYQYEGVPTKFYEELMNAPSKGKYFHFFIKGHFPYKKL